jgi:hypothetical protein
MRNPPPRRMTPERRVVIFKVVEGTLLENNFSLIFGGLKKK